MDKIRYFTVGDLIANSTILQEEPTYQTVSEIMYRNDIYLRDIDKRYDILKRMSLQWDYVIMKYNCNDKPLEDSVKYLYTLSYTTSPMSPDKKQLMVGNIYVAGREQPPVIVDNSSEKLTITSYLKSMFKPSKNKAQKIFETMLEEMPATIKEIVDKHYPDCDQNEVIVTSLFRDPGLSIYRSHRIVEFDSFQVRGTLRQMVIGKTFDQVTVPRGECSFEHATESDVLVDDPRGRLLGKLLIHPHPLVFLFTADDLASRRLSENVITCFSYQQGIYCSDMDGLFKPNDDYDVRISDVMSLILQGMKKFRSKTLIMDIPSCAFDRERQVADREGFPIFLIRHKVKLST